MIPKAQSSRIDKDGSCRYIEQQSGNLIETGPKMKIFVFFIRQIDTPKKPVNKRPNWIILSYKTGALCWDADAYGA